MPPILEWCAGAASLALFLIHLLGADRLDRLWRKFLLALVNILGRLTVRWLKLLCHLHKILK